MFPLAKKLKKTDKGIHRMPGPRGNNILEIIRILQANEQVSFRAEAHKAAA